MSDEKNSLADQAAAWVPPWARQPSPSESRQPDPSDESDSGEPPAEPDMASPADANAVSPVDTLPADASLSDDERVEPSAAVLAESPVELTESPVVAVSPADPEPVDDESAVVLADSPVEAEAVSPADVEPAEPNAAERADPNTGETAEPSADEPSPAEVVESPVAVEAVSWPAESEPLDAESDIESVEVETAAFAELPDEAESASLESEESDMSEPRATVDDLDSLAAGSVASNGRYGDRLGTPVPDQPAANLGESEMSGEESAAGHTPGWNESEETASGGELIIGDLTTDGQAGERAASTAADEQAGEQAADEQAADEQAADEQAADEQAGEQVADEQAGEQVGERAASTAADGLEGAEQQGVGEQTALPIAGESPDGAKVELSDDELRGAVEAILLIVDEPVTEIILAQVLDQPVDRISGTLERCSREYAEKGRGFELRRIAGGWRLYTRPEYAAYVEKFVLDGQQVRLTQAALETLAVVAYKQPVTRSRISAIRGVNCDGVVRTLVARGLIEECGSEPESGAFLYRTTTLFLEKLGLDSVDELPPLAPFLPDDVDEIADAQR